MIKTIRELWDTLKEYKRASDYYDTVFICNHKDTDRLKKQNTFGVIIPLSGLNLKKIKK